MRKKVIKYIFLIIICLPVTGYLQNKNVSRDKKNDQRYRLALQYENAGRFNEAYRIYRQLWDADIKNMSYYTGAKNTLIQLNRLDEAMVVVEKMLTVNRNYYIESDIGDIYYKGKEKEKALEIWNRIIKKYETHPGAYQAVATAMLSNRLYDEAIEIYKTGRKNINNETVFLLELANLFSSRLDYKNATLMYLEYLYTTPTQFSFVESQIYNLVKNIEEAEPIIEIINSELRKDRDSVLLRKLLAGLYIRNSNYGKALDEYKYIDQKLEQKTSLKKEELGKDLYDFGMDALNDGAYRVSAQAFQIFLARYPDSPIAPVVKLGLAESYAQQENYQEAITLYQQIISTYHGLKEAEQSYFQIGDMKLNHFSDAEGAKESFIAILKINSNHFKAMFKLAECEIRTGNLIQAQRWYQKVFASKNANIEIKEEARYKLAEIDFWEKNFDAALVKLDQIIDVQPILRNFNNGFYVNDALNLSIFIKENRQQEDWLKEYAECMLLIEQRQYVEAMGMLTQLENKVGRYVLVEDIIVKIGEIENKLQNHEKAIMAYRSLIEKHPKSFKCDLAQLRIGDIYRDYLKEPVVAIKEYEQVLENYPESLYIEDVRRKIRELEKLNN